MERVGKNVGHKPHFKAAIRHRQPLLCAQGALGRYLVHRFHPELRGAPIPDPLSEEWLKLVMFPESKTDAGEAGGLLVGAAVQARSGRLQR